MAPAVSVDEAKLGRGGGPGAAKPVRVEYSGQRGFEAAARRLGIMDNIKAGVPRGAYHGVVTVRLGPHKRKVHVAPPLREIQL